MAKNVLILSASPRRQGNSDILCDRFLEGAREKGHTVEKIFLRDYKIGFCTGCGYCFDAHTCSQKDDMTPLLEKMVGADVIVFATPVYFYSMDAQLKCFIDRTTPRYTEMVGKTVYFLLTAADTDENNLHSTVEALRGFTRDCLEGAVEGGILYGTGAWKAGEIRETPAFHAAYEMGKAL